MPGRVRKGIYWRCSVRSGHGQREARRQTMANYDARPLGIKTGQYPSRMHSPFSPSTMKICRSSATASISLGRRYGTQSLARLQRALIPMVLAAGVLDRRSGALCSRQFSRGRRETCGGRNLCAKEKGRSGDANLSGHNEGSSPLHASRFPRVAWRCWGWALDSPWTLAAEALLRALTFS